MACWVDLDDEEQVLDASGVARVMGWRRRNSVSVARGRDPNFPAPRRRFGNSDVWDRRDIDDYKLARLAP